MVLAQKARKKLEKKFFKLGETILRERERETLKICSRGRSGSRINIVFVKEAYLLYK